MIIAAIPVKNNLKWTAPIVEQLLLGDDIDYLWIYDNGSTDGTRAWIENRQNLDARLVYIDASMMRFYEMWNDMINMANAYDGSKLAILNNDLHLPHMALKTMADNLGDYTIGTIDTQRVSINGVGHVHITEITDYRHRVGWAFMVNADFWKDVEFPIDPRFNLWYGDDYLYRRTMELGGRVCTVNGVGCDHAVSQSHDQYQNLNPDIEADKELFYSLWP